MNLVQILVHNIRTWQTSSGEANLGQCFMVINTASFADGTEERLQNLIDHVHNMEPVRTLFLFFKL